MSKSRANAILLAAAGVCLSASAFGAINVTETFTTDPGWEGSLNRQTGPTPGHPYQARNDFGWSNTDNTGTTVQPPGGAATAAGELGGQMGATIDAYYADQVGPFSYNDALHFSGVLRYNSVAQQTLIGFFNSTATTPGLTNESGGSGRRNQFLGLMQQARGAAGGSHQMHLVSTGTAGSIETEPGTDPEAANATASNQIQDNQVYPFSFDYSPTGGAGFGYMTLFVGGGVISADNTPNDGTFTYNFTEEERALMAGTTFDRFGIATSAIGGDRGPEVVFYDDLTYSAIVPEPSCLALAVIGGVFLRRRSA